MRNYCRNNILVYLNTPYSSAVHTSNRYVLKANVPKKKEFDFSPWSL
jgi:hypothetical protein